MQFYPNQLFHIYNQGNNRQQIFFSHENYCYFLWKMRAYLLPFGDLVAYCLMPNHFHWLFYVRRVAIERKVLRTHVDKVESIRKLEKFGYTVNSIKNNSNRIAKDNSLIRLNNAIGIIQKSYSQALHKERGSSGSLFRKPCKAKDGWIDELITLEKSNKKEDYRFFPGTDFAYQCFCYIHNNPVKAGLVEEIEDWPYSSARDYTGLRDGSLCNLTLGKSLIKYV